MHVTPGMLCRFLQPFGLQDVARRHFDETVDSGPFEKSGVFSASSDRHGIRLQIDEVFRPVLFEKRNKLATERFQIEFRYQTLGFNALNLTHRFVLTVLSIRFAARHKDCVNTKN